MVVNERTVPEVGLLIMLLIILYALNACTIKIDNPFYAPSTLDVNKSKSEGAENYLSKVKPKANE